MNKLSYKITRTTNPIVIVFSQNGPNFYVSMQTYAPDGSTPANNVLSKTPIEILIY